MGPCRAKVRRGPCGPGKAAETFSAQRSGPRQGPGAGKAGGTTERTTTAAASKGLGAGKGPRPRREGGATGATWFGGGPGPARYRGPRPTEAHPERRFPSPPPQKESAGGSKPTKAYQPGGPTRGDLYKAAYQRQKEEREAQALTAMAGVSEPARPKPPAEAQPLPEGTVPVVEAREKETLVVPAPPYKETDPAEQGEKKKRHRNRTHGKK